METLDFTKTVFNSRQGDATLMRELEGNYLFKTGKGVLWVDKNGNSVVSGKQSIFNKKDHTARYKKNGRAQKLRDSVNKPVYVFYSFKPYIKTGTLLGRTKTGTYNVYDHNADKVVKAISSNIFVSKKELSDLYQDILFSFKKHLGGYDA